MTAVGTLLPRTCATARPQLAEADTHSQAHPLVNRTLLSIRDEATNALKKLVAHPGFPGPAWFAWMKAAMNRHEASHERNA